MHKTDPLHELIHSLNKSEKRFFRLFSGITAGEKNYLRVFDAMESMKEYDPALLKRRLSKFRINLSYEKNYLYKQLMKVLRVFHSDNSVDGQMEITMRDIELLLEKRLLSQAAKQIEKALEFAEENELFAHLFNLFRLRTRLAFREGDYRHLYHTLENQLPLEKAALAKYEKLAALRALQHRIFSIVQTNGIVSGQGLAELDSIMKHPLLRSAPKGLPFVARIIYYECHGSYNLQRTRYEKAFEMGKKAVQCFEDDPGKKESYLQGYFACLSNLATRSILLRYDKETEEVVQKLKALLSHSRSAMTENMQTEINLSVFEKELLLAVYEHNFQKAISASERMESFMDERRTRIRQHIRIFHQYYTAWVYFSIADYKKALTYINRTLNNKELNTRMDLLTETQILNIMCHYELGNDDLVNSAVASAQRFLKQNGVALRSPAAILQMFRKLVKEGDNKMALRQVMKAAERELKDLASDRSEKMLMESLEILEWLRHRSH